MFSILDYSTILINDSLHRDLDDSITSLIEQYGFRCTNIEV